MIDIIIIIINLQMSIAILLNKVKDLSVICHFQCQATFSFLDIDIRVDNALLEEKDSFLQEIKTLYLFCGKTLILLKKVTSKTELFWFYFKTKAIHAKIMEVNSPSYFRAATAT